MQKQSFMNAEDFSATSLNKTKRSSPSATTSSQKLRKTTRFDEHCPPSLSKKHPTPPRTNFASDTASGDLTALE